MAYKVTKTPIQDLLVLEPTVFGDERGFFMESFNQQKFNDATGSDIDFVQDNHSRSVRGVIRGLHFQKDHPQGKLVRVAQGAVFDVAVDIRPGSKTFAKWFGIELSAQNKKQLWIPPGFAHGFEVLSDVSDFLYKTTTYYDPLSELGILWCDEKLNIEWRNNGNIIISKKDKLLNSFEDMQQVLYEIKY